MFQTKFLRFLTLEEDMLMFLSNFSVDFELTEEQDEELSSVVFDMCIEDIQEVIGNQIGHEYFCEEKDMASKSSPENETDDERKKRQRERSDALKKLPDAFRPQTHDSEKEKLKKSALRGSMYKYNADLKKWVPREKPREFGTVLADLVKRKQKFEHGLAKKASQKAVNQRLRNKDSKSNLETVSSKILNKTE